ncbi:MAG: hypothetical protein QNJ53_11785 [Pleurocapsa sp. MO_192.B19]|nr:hypothetical protein [Pleurocapsa sp. MO_192.B19]
MNTQQATRSLHQNHKHLRQIALVAVIFFGSMLMGLVPLIYGLSSTDTQGTNFVVPTEAEL